MGQTSYPTQQPAGAAGQIADLAPHLIVSKRNKAGADIPFGVALIKEASADDAVTLPSAGTGAGSKVIGLAVFAQNQNNISLTTGLAPASGTSILSGDRFNVMRKGRMWVVPDGAVVAEGPVYARYATGGATGTGPTANVIGTLRGDADTNGAVAVPGAKFLDTAAAGVPARVEFDDQVSVQSP